MYIYIDAHKHACMYTHTLMDPWRPSGAPRKALCGAPPRPRAGPSPWAHIGPLQWCPCAAPSPSPVLGPPLGPVLGPRNGAPVWRLPPAAQAKLVNRL